MLIIGGYKAREITVTYILRTKYCPNLTHPIMLKVFVVFMMGSIQDCIKVTWMVVLPAIWKPTYCQIH